MMQLLRRYLAVFALPALLVVGAGPAAAASKLTVAAVGDLAPGGGLFAGPSFTSWPAAGGNGWVAFRSLLEGGNAAEALVAAHFSPPVARVEVAHLGKQVDGAGTIRAFLGRPSINASGAVAFFASFRPTDGIARIGVFLFDPNAAAGTDSLRVIAQHGDTTAAGVLDLGRRIEPGVDPESDDTPDRAAVINDAGTIAFTAALQAGGAAVFRVAPGSALDAIVRTSGPLGSMTFRTFGGPAINASGAVAFRATLDDPSTPDGSEALLLSNGTTVVQRVVRGTVVNAPSDAPPPVYAATLQEFGNVVTVNDSGDIGFTAGPLLDPNDPGDDPEQGAFVSRGSTTFLLAYPGQALTAGRATSVRLGSAGDTQVAPPVISNDGSATVFVSISDGNVELIRRVVRPYALANGKALLEIGGQSPDGVAAAGTYRATASAVAVDASGGVAFFARLTGGTTPEAVVYQPAVMSGTTSIVALGEPNPGSGYFSGPAAAFSPPTLTDLSDVIFKAFVARGQTSVGIFKTHIERLTSGEIVRTTTRLVGAGDVTPAGARLIDLLGVPAVASDGTVAFAALVNRGRGVYRIAPDGTISTIVERGNSAPGESIFGSVGVNPSVVAGGAVAFRASLRPLDPEEPSSEGIFLADARGITTQVMRAGATRAGNIVRLRDPALSTVPSIAFRATVALPKVPNQPPPLERAGLFFYAGTEITTIGLQDDPFDGGALIADFAGTPSFGTNGDLAFLVTRTQDGAKIGSALVRRRNGEQTTIAAVLGAAPAGGTYKSLGAPSIGPSGRLAFRAAVDHGGIGGIFVASDRGIEPVVVTNESTPIEGRFSSFGAGVSINANDDLAFAGNVSGGISRSGLFVASATQLQVPTFTIRLSGGKKRDRVSLRLALSLGHLSDGIDPVTQGLTITLSDATGQLQVIRVAPGVLIQRRQQFVVARQHSLPSQLRKLRLRIGRRQTYQAQIKTGLLDLTHGGTRPLQPPLSVSFEVGDDSGLAIAPCRVKPTLVRCGD